MDPTSKETPVWVPEFSQCGQDKEQKLSNCMEDFRRELRPFKTVCLVQWNSLPSFLRPKFRVVAGLALRKPGRRLSIGLYLF